MDINLSLHSLHQLLFLNTIFPAIWRPNILEDLATLSRRRAGLLLTLPLLAVAETAEMLAGVVQEHGDSGVIKAGSVWLWQAQAQVV